MKRILIYIVAAIVAVGCFTDENYDSLLIFRTAYQPASDGDFVEMEGAVIYAFAADTTEYIPMSYEDALNGVVTHKTSGKTLTPTAKGEPYEGVFSYIYEAEEDDEMLDDVVAPPYADGEVVETTITGVALRAALPIVMLVVVDTVNEDYAYCNYEVGLNLTTTYLSLAFRPWRSAPFDQGFWHYVVPIVKEPVTEPETAPETETE